MGKNFWRHTVIHYFLRDSHCQLTVEKSLLLQVTRAFIDILQFKHIPVWVLKDCPS